MLPPLLRRYGVATTLVIPSFDATTGQDVADDATGWTLTRSVDGAAYAALATPAASLNAAGEPVATLSATETQASQQVRVRARKAGRLDQTLVVETIGDALARHPHLTPSAGPVHSATPSAVTATGATLPAAPTLGDAALWAQLVDNAGRVYSTGAAVVGAAVTFAPAFAVAPANIVRVHLYASPLQLPLDSSVQVGLGGIYATQLDTAADGVAAIQQAVTALSASVGSVGTAVEGIADEVIQRVPGAESWRDTTATVARTRTVTVYAPNGTTPLGTRVLSYDSTGEVVGMGRLIP